MLVSLNKDLHEYTQQKLMILLAFFMLVSLFHYFHYLSMSTPKN